MEEHTDTQTLSDRAVTSNDPRKQQQQKPSFLVSINSSKPNLIAIEGETEDEDDEKEEEDDDEKEAKKKVARAN